MLLVKDGVVIDDPYLSGLDDAPIADGADVIVSAERFFADAAGFSRRAGRTGLLWPNHRPVSELASHLDHLALIALVFPTFRDGRAYSQASLLRERYGFSGELRATGDILRDQFQFLNRAGFDAFAVKKPEDAKAVCGAIHHFSVVYQPAADGRMTAFARRRRVMGSTSVKKEPAL